MQDTDVAILGAGAAGLSFAYWLCVTSPQNAPSSLTLIEAPPGPARPAERTWCFWEGPDGAYDTALTAQWRSLRVRGGRDGGSVTGCPSPLRYKMLRSTDFKALVEARLEKSPGVRRVEATVREVHDVPGGALVQGSTAQGGPLNLRARWVFDSRPLPRLPPSRTTWLQHFRGWFLRSARPVFDPRTADLMDFRTAQPADGLSFGYVLPTSPYEALVEYTEFSPAVLDDNGYGQALRQYVGDVLGLDEYEVTGVEQGVIPMTDARFPRRAGRSVFRIGTAGGATRPATGYTFAAIQRQARAVTASYRRGRVPVPPPAHPPRSLAMDAVLLRALATARVEGPEFFTGLFRHVPMERLLRFLDGGTRWHEDFTVGLHTPVGPMLATAMELPWLPRRTAPARCPTGPQHPSRSSPDRREV